MSEIKVSWPEWLDAFGRKLDTTKLFVTPPDEDVKGVEPEWPRASVLNEAISLITGDRNNTYGPPTQDFTRTAEMANAMGYRAGNGRELQAHDVAILIALVKLSRLAWTPGKRDSWVDLAGYAACGYECAVEEGHQA